MTDSDAMLKKLIKFVKCEQLFKPKDKILLAISGGADSMAMLSLFYQLRPTLDLSLLAVHINHQLRGKESYDDEIFVQEQCRFYNVPVITRRITLNTIADIENQARMKRFDIYMHLLTCYQFQYVALAHHMNDQAETILMNMFRGAGIRGLSGIKPKNGKVIHPLLCFSRDQLVNYLHSQNIPYRIDSSNDDIRYRRNYIRKVTIPEILSCFNPNFINNINEQAEVLRKTDNLLSTLASKYLRKLILDQGPDHITLSLPMMMSLSSIEQYYCCREVYRCLFGTEKDFYRKMMNAINALCYSQGSKVIQFKNDFSVIRQYDKLVFLHKENQTEQEQIQSIMIDEKRSRLVFLNYRFIIKRVKVLPRNVFKFQDSREVILDEDKIRYPLIIRLRNNGDRFIPLGMHCEKKLKDFFIDEKVPKFDRDKIPIFCDSNKIIWIVGYRIDQRVAINDLTTRYLIIRFEPITSIRKRAATRRSNQGDKDECYEL